MPAILALSYLTLFACPCPHPRTAPPVRPEPRGGLSLRLADPHHLLPAGARAVAAEVTSIFGALGVTVRWQASEADPAPPGIPLRVVLLPSAPSGPGWRLGSNALGVTVGDGVATAPAVYVFYPRLRRAVDVPDRSQRLPSLLELRRLSRALGRVIAHEIFHALAPGHPHATSGLMSAELTPELLLGEDAPVDPRWTRLLQRATLAPTSREASPLAPGKDR